MKQVSDINILKSRELPSPDFFCNELKRTEKQAEFVAQSREQIHKIIFGSDHRHLLIVGPCSIHDIKSGKEYAEKLAALSSRVADRIMLVMRVYFEKPRTTIGWKGLIMDPHLDGTYDIPHGIKMAREFLLNVLDLGLPTATEFLDPITPQYISDLTSWAAIGARTSESQTHRQMASGLSMPLGFKNNTAGNVIAAINAIKAACQQQTFLGISHQGIASAVTTRGNPNCHIVLRGGDNGPNFEKEHIESTVALLKKNNLPSAVMVDCSHANSSKDHTKQGGVLKYLLDQIENGNDSIIGSMLESNLVAGNQSFPCPKEDLVYGQSITDACIDWDSTEKLILESYKSLESRFAVAT